MGHKLKVPIYINGSDDTETNRELYMDETTNKKILKCGENGSTDIRVKESEQSDKSIDVNNENKLDTTQTNVKIGGTWEPKTGKNAKFSGIQVDNNGTKLSDSGIIILNNSMYGSTRPTGTTKGQLFFVIPTT